MAGQFNLMGSIGAYRGPGSTPTATTASEAAFGQGASDSTGSGTSLAPSHPAGIVLWGGLISGGLLVGLYRSLPAERRADFELVLIMYVLLGPAKGLVKLPLQRLAQEPQTQGPIDKLARAALWVLS